jgi:ApbE superfamily uncharacterized protein (UPF0280 family)
LKTNLFGPVYRELPASSGLEIFDLRRGESDLRILAEGDFRARARAALEGVRRRLRAYLAREPLFGSSLTPVLVSPGAPEIARRMAAAAARCGLGPMASVAGAVAAAVGEAAAEVSEEVIVENGGDLYLRLRRARTVEVYPGPGHRLQGRLRLKIPPGVSGVATSSGRWGRSLSFGKADAALVAGADPVLVDAAATALGNRVLGPEAAADPGVGDFILELPGIRGYLLVAGEIVQIRGDLELV